MKKLVWLALASLVVSGCVSTKSVSMSDGVRQALADRPVHPTTRAEPPAFAAQTAGKAMFGGIGAAAMIKAGNDLVRENDITDPAPGISQALAAEVAARFSAHAAEAVAMEDGNPLTPTAGYVVDVRTVNWSFIYFPTDWDNYRVIYSAQMRVLDPEGAVVAQEFCSRVPEYSEDAPTYDQLLADGAARLKQEIAIAGDHCLAQFRARTGLI